MKGLQRIVRRAIMARLKRNAGVLALVPASSIHSQAPLSAPEWPFIKMGPPTTTPRRAAGLDAGTVLVSVHAFSRGRFDGDDLVETAEDYAGWIGEAIEHALDAKGEDISNGTATGHVRYEIVDQQLLVDGGEPDAFHWFGNVRARVSAR